MASKDRSNHIIVAEQRRRNEWLDRTSSYRKEKNEETLKHGARDEIAMKVNKP